MKVRAPVPTGPLQFGLLLGAAVVGCKSTGEGMGESRTGDVQANFTWEQSAPSSGKLTATVTKPGGAQETYEGKFYQITSNTRIETPLRRDDQR
jgi:hypothetical protein